MWREALSDSRVTCRSGLVGLTGVATVRLTAGLLPLLEPRMGIKPTTTKRTSPPREHSLLQSTAEGEANRASKKREKAKGKGY
jgi:hypothetical protein